MSRPPILAQIVLNSGQRFELIDPTSRIRAARFLRLLREAGPDTVRRVAEHQYAVISAITGHTLYEVLIQTFDPEPDEESFYGADTCEDAAAELGHADATYYRSR